MAQIALTLGGAVLGSYFGPVGTSLGAMAGGMIGGYIDSLWLAPKSMRQPSAVDTAIQGASYGKPIPNCYGTIRIAGELIWSGGIIEHDATQSVGSAKGLSGGASVDQPYYTASFAVGLCAGPIAAVRRVWADKKLLGDFSPGSFSVLMRGGTMHIYYGDEDQLPSAFIQQARGIAYVPAFRGLAYLIIENIQLQDFANHLPQIEAEVVVPRGPAPHTALMVGGLNNRSGFNADVLDLTRGVYYSIGNNSSGTSGLVKIDAYTGAVAANNPAIPQANGMEGNTSLGADGKLYFISDHITDFSMPGSPYRAEFSRINPNSLAIEASTPMVSSTPPVWLGTFIRNRYGYAIICRPDSDTALPPAINLIAEKDLTIVVAAYPLDGETAGGTVYSGAGMADLDAALNVWYFARVGPAAAYGSAILYQYTWNSTPGTSGIPAGQSLTLAAQWDLTAAFTTPPKISPPGPGCCCMYLPDENALLLSVDGASLVKWDIASQTISGPENFFGTSSGAAFWGTVGANGTWQQGEVNGQLVFNGGGSKINIINTADWTLAETIDWTDYSPPVVTPVLSGYQYDQTNGWLYITQTGLPGMARLDINRYDPTYTTLGEIVSDICLRAGYAPADIDVTQLTQQVRGYVIGRPTDGAACIQALMDAYFFDAVESDGKVKFINRGGAPAATLVKGDLGAYDEKGARPDPLEIDDAQAEDLPLLVEVTYIDEGLDYDRGLQASRRIASNGIVEPAPSRTKKPLDLPIVFLPNEAKAAADTQLVSEWIARQSYKYTLGRKWIALDPADVIEINKDGNLYLMRLTQTDYGANGAIQIQGVKDDPKVYNANAVGINSIGRGPHGDSGTFTAVDTVPVSPTILEIFETPALRDADAVSAGFYMAGGPALPAPRQWSGAMVMRSVDAGASFTQWERIGYVSAIGYATTALPPPPANQFAPAGAWATWDSISSVTVRMVCGSDLLASASNELAVLNGANAALVGGEVVQFSTVTVNADGTFTLGGGMTRGRRGTDPWIGGHAAGELFILLSPGTLVSVTEETGAIGMEREYQGVSIGEGAPTEGAIAFAEQGYRLMPYAVGHIAGARDGADNLTITWIRRTRSGGDNSWLDGVTEVPLAETGQSYSIDILDGSGLVRRTLSAAAPMAVYAAADQTADFGAPQPSVKVQVYQISSLVGRGFGAGATV